MDRNLLIVIVISLVSTIAGVFFYRSSFMQPEFISASTNVSSTPHQAGDNSEVANLTFDQIVLNDLQSQPRKLNEWNSPVIVVNFWAPWCPPCLREIPALVDLQERYKDDMQLIGLSFDTAKNVIDFSANNTLNYPLLLVQSEATQINQFFGNSSKALPFTAILNQQRDIVFHHSGEITRQQLEQQIKALL